MPAAQTTIAARVASPLIVRSSLTPAVMEVLDKSVQLANAVDKIARMPGISKLAKVMANKADQNLQKQAEKAQRGLGVEPDPS